MQSIVAWTSVMVTVAALAKTFVPFYFVSSTAIFIIASSAGMLLAALSWRSIFNAGRFAVFSLVTVALFYAVIAINFLAISSGAVPATHLGGILIIHATMIAFGFSAARAPKRVLLVLLCMAATYVAMLALHGLRFGHITTGTNIDDIFGIGVPDISSTFHQNIGQVLSMGLFALAGLASNRLARIAAWSALPIVVLLFHAIAARTALVALAATLILLGLISLWGYSRKASFLSIAAAVTASTIVLLLIWKYPLSQIEVDINTHDAISRTIRELQNPNPGFRLSIWEQTWLGITNNSDRLVFGHGLGMFPLETGHGAPDWLPHPTEGSKHYPHNVHLEILYEAGLVGLLLFIALTISPIVASARRWPGLSAPERSAVAIYIFNLASADISGGFAYTYLLEFFLALTIGIIALRRADREQTSEFSVSHP